MVGNAVITRANAPALFDAWLWFWHDCDDVLRFLDAFGNLLLHRRSWLGKLDSSNLHRIENLVSFEEILGFLLVSAVGFLDGLLVCAKFHNECTVFPFADGAATFLDLPKGHPIWRCKPTEAK